MYTIYIYRYIYSCTYIYSIYMYIIYIYIYILYKLLFGGLWDTNLWFFTLCLKLICNNNIIPPHVVTKRFGTNTSSNYFAGMDTDSHVNRRTISRVLYLSNLKKKTVHDQFFLATTKQKPLTLSHRANHFWKRDCFFFRFFFFFICCSIFIQVSTGTLYMSYIFFLLFDSTHPQTHTQKKTKDTEKKTKYTIRQIRFVWMYFFFTKRFFFLCVD